MIGLRDLPTDINAELILGWLPEGSFRLAMDGQHKRNAYNDIVEIERRTDDSLIFHIGRNGLYNALPEYLFHPLDRFSNLPPYEEKERFGEELERQEQEKENASKFFEPLDLQLLLYRVMTREKLRHVTETDSVITGLLADNLTDSQRANRFVMHTLPFLVSCRHIRGDRTLLTQMVRKVMMDEGMEVSSGPESMVWKDTNARYTESIGGGLDDTYLGSVYDEEAMVLSFRYRPERIDDSFPKLLDEIEEYREFVSDWFMAVGSVLVFGIRCDDNVIILGDENVYNYLNYNTDL